MVQVCSALIVIASSARLPLTCMMRLCLSQEMKALARDPGTGKGPWQGWTAGKPQTASVPRHTLAESLPSTESRLQATCHYFHCGQSQVEGVHSCTLGVCGSHNDIPPQVQCASNDRQLLQLFVRLAYPYILI
jgi:hypothetical protein